MKRVLFVVCVLGVMGGATLAWAAAAEGLDTERFKPALDSQGVILTEGGQGEEGGDLNVGLYLHYSHNPLVLRLGDEVLTSLVSDRIGASLFVSMGMTSWLTIGLELPAFLSQSGEIRDPNTGTDLGLTSAAIGDIRVSPKLTFLREKSQGISLALAIPVSLPSGDETAYVGSKSVTASPTLAASRHLLGDRLLLAANLGIWLHQAADYQNLNAGSEVFYKLGVGVQFVNKLWALGELAGAGKLDGLFKNKSNDTPMEWLLGLRYQGPLGLSYTLGGAFGSLPGWGTPNYRAFLGVLWAPRVVDQDGDGVVDSDDPCPTDPGPPENNGCPWGDKDNDGLKDNEDRCPDQAGPAENQGCPWSDKDKDGVTDNKDRCPDVVGPAENQGCPWGDKDKDGVLDNKDKCPDVPGPTENQGCPWGDKDKDGVVDNVDKCPDTAGPPENTGCPWGDKDKDGVLDNEDKCPDAPGPAASQGCPSDRDKDGVYDKDDKCPNKAGPVENQGCPGKILVVVKAEKIEILQKVHFQTARAVIMGDSFTLLNQVAQVIKTHSEIKKLRVEGHTDSQGPDAANQRLSEARANSVRDYLVKQGVAAERLEAMGFGETKPIAPNETARGREANRRVEFMIVEQASAQ